MNSLFSKFGKFKFFLGPEVWFLFRISFFIGLLWFLIESSFVFVLQAFLSSIGLIKPEQSFLSGFFPESMAGATFLLFLFGVFRALAVMARQVSSEMTFQAFLKTQRVRIIEYALSNASELSTHELLNVFNERIPVAATIFQYVSTLATIGVSSACFLFFGLYLAPVECAIGVSSLLGLFFFLRFFNRRIDAISENLIRETRQLTRALVIGLRNHFLLKLYRLTDAETDAAKAAATSYQSYYNRYIWLSAAKSAFPQFSGAIIVSLLCLISFRFVHTPAAKLVSFIYVFMRLAQSLGEANAVVMAIRLNIISFRELYHWNVLSQNFLIRKAESTRVEGVSDVDFSGGVFFRAKDVSFGYHDSDALFSHISFELNPGETLLLKGPSGSGKSTLLTVLLGLRQPRAGLVLVNGHAAHEVLPRLSAVVAYVGPESYLVPGSFRDNLLYANPRAAEIPDEEIWDSLRRVLLDDLVSRNPKQLEGIIKEAAELSTGQRQRLAIARALLRKPRLLVLDEATANLDPATEKEVIEVIRSLPNKVTMIVISHKDSFDRMATVRISL